MSDLSDFIAASQGLPSAFRKDQPVGTIWRGRVVRASIQQTRDDDGNPEVWTNGDPKKQIVVAIETDQRDPERPGDDGVRGIYIKTWSQPRVAFLAAMSAAKATDIQPDGYFAAQYIGEGPQPQNKMLSPEKHFKYEYRPPTGIPGLLSESENGKKEQAPAEQSAAQPAPPTQPAPSGSSMLDKPQGPAVDPWAAAPGGDPWTAPPPPAQPPVQQPAAAPAPAAAAPAAAPSSNGAPGGNSQLETIRSMIGLQMTDDLIAQAVGVPAMAVAAIRNLPA
jgi:hypothetical protein